MRIKRLEIEGFKSFPNRAEILFTDNIVGIVGPNGCGKSNVVDAIRWAMGEQSAKNLRGGKMEDVIFNGTATRLAQNFAEVSVTFINQNGTFPPPYTECSEIMITRRLYRSGESEYMINKVVCRLKDITDLFLGTGSSPKAYSIIEQGKIDAFVMMHPEERRNLIEEAAGISKFKHRKMIALRKMEATEMNLTRIDDIIREVERQKNYLKRQVQKAERFKRFSEEFRKRHLKVQWYRYGELESKFNLVKTGKSEEQDQLFSLQGEARRFESDIEATKLEILGLEESLSSIGNAIQANKDGIQRLENGIEMANVTIQNRREQLSERREDIQRIDTKLVANDETLVRVNQQIQAIESQIADVQKRLEEKVARLEAVAVSHQAFAVEVNRLKSEIVESQVLVTGITVEQNGLKEALGSIDGEVTGYERSLSECRVRLAQLSQEILEKQIELGRCDEKLVEMSHRMALGKVRSEGLQRESLVLSEERLFLNGEAERIKAAILQLESVKAKREAFFKERLDAIGRSGVDIKARVLVDLLEVETGFEKALGVALDVLMKGILVNGQDKLSSLLKGASGASDSSENAATRSIADFGNFFGLETQITAVAGRGAVEIVNGIEYVPLISKVSVRDPDAEGLIQRWLSHVWFVEKEDLESIAVADVALLASRSNTPEILIVNRRGDWFDSRGVIYKESRQVVEGRLIGEGHLFDVTDELEKIQARLQTVQSQLREVEEGLKETLALHAETVEAQEKLGTEYQEVAADRLTVEKDIEKLQSDMEVGKKVEEETTARVVLLQARRREASEKIASIDERRASAATTRGDLEQRLARTESDFGRARGEEEAAREEVTEIRIMRASLGEKFEALTQERRYGEISKSDFSNNIAQYENEIRQWETEISTLLGKIEESRTEIQQRTIDLDARSREFQELKVRYEQKKESVQQFEAQYRERQQGLERLNLALGEQRMLERELEVRLQHLIEAVGEKYRIDIRTYEPELTQAEKVLLTSDEPPTDETAGAAESVGTMASDGFEDASEDVQPSAEVMPCDGASEPSDEMEVDVSHRSSRGSQPSWTTVEEWVKTLEAECETLKEKLDKLGEVNLLAISEYKELEERFVFLTGQREDLVLTLDKLRKVIDRINRITKERFLTTFHAINHNFQLIFPRLFEGGKARLFMTDETNILETGVDIVVEPPGKKSQHISLLSGGEKALTSVSLIFALFTYRPSSFCILDEVDAPLDDLNTGRYNEIVRDMSKLSQFILITHNKRTMEIADVLYGVTMPENGASQVVSVRFAEAERLAASG